MRSFAAFALLGLGLMVATPASAGGDDSLPYWAPYRGHSHCDRLFWRERCGYYKLGGYFERRYKIRRAAVVRRVK